MLHRAQVVSWTLVYTKQAQKDAKKIASSGLRPNVERLLGILAIDPFRTPPPYETLVGILKGAISRRINIQHRLVYQVLQEEHVVKVLRMWTHYEQRRNPRQMNGAYFDGSALPGVIIGDCRIVRTTAPRRTSR